MRVAHIVRVYRHAFTARRTPYFIAYSAYVAITILVRVNAFLSIGSVVQRCLHHCLDVLAESERINAGVKRASFVVSKLFFAVARTGPNPFPKGDMSPPWGEVATDNVQLNTSIIPRIIATFSTSSPDSAAEQSQLEIEKIEPGLSGSDLAPMGETNTANGPWDLDPGHAAHLLASLRSNTPAIHSGVATPRPPPMQELNAPFPDIIFGLHNDESFQAWPDFNNDLDAMFWMPNLPLNGPQNG